MPNVHAARGAGWAVAATICLFVAGCDRDGTWDSPDAEATYRTFLMHWFKGEQAEAFEMIDPQDREHLTQPMKELRDHLEDSAMPSRSDMLVAGRVDNPYDMKSIDVEPELDQKPEVGRRVTLELQYQDGRSGEATMVWRGDAWYVDLPLEAPSDTKPEAAPVEDGGPPTDDADLAPETGERGSTDATTGDKRD